jgi:hypothetical protein
MFKYDEFWISGENKVADLQYPSNSVEHIEAQQPIEHPRYPMKMKQLI